MGLFRRPAVANLKPPPLTPCWDGGFLNAPIAAFRSDVRQRLILEMTYSTSDSTTLSKIDVIRGK